MITPSAQARLDANPKEFFRTMIDVVVEQSEVGLTVWDDQGRYIVIEHGQLFQPLPVSLEELALHPDQAKADALPAGWVFCTACEDGYPPESSHALNSSSSSVVRQSQVVELVVPE